MITKKQIIPIIIIFIQCFAMYSISFSQPARLMRSGGPAHPSGGDTLFQADCGILWLPPVQLSNSNYSAFSPKIALSGDDTVHVTWQNSSLTIRLPYARSTNGGISFEATREILTDSIKFPYQAQWTQLASYERKVCIFFKGASGGKTPLSMIKSEDGGTLWDSVKNISPDTCGEIVSSAVYLDTLAVVYNPTGDYKKILRSSDGGNTWTRTNEDLSYYSSVALGPGTLHLVHGIIVNNAQEKLYMRSFDLGNTWADKETLSTVDGISALEHAIAAYSKGSDSSWVMAAWRDAKYGCLGGYGLGCSIIERESNENGTKWNNEEVLTNEPRGLNPAISLYDSIAAIIWVHDVNVDLFHVYFRVRYGKSRSWCEPFDVTPFSNYLGTRLDIVLSKKAVHVVWQEMIGDSIRKSQIFYRRGVFLTTDVKESKETIPTEFSLSQNYPNPFNQSTIINYQLSKPEIVSLKIYDIFGREIKTLVNERKEAGKYEVEWNAEGLSSGVYFIRMLAGKYISTIKTILMK